jgi:hypothetical protein
VNATSCHVNLLELRDEKKSVVGYFEICYTDRQIRNSGRRQQRCPKKD